MIGTRLHTLAAMIAALTTTGCGLFGKTPPEPPKPLVYPLCLQASQNVNSKTTLYVRIYQLSTADAFLQTDPRQMLEKNFTLNGAVGAPIEKTLFPADPPKTDGKIHVDVPQNPDATVLGIVGFYWEPSGPVKARRQLPQRGDKPPKEPPGCVVFGEGGVENQ
jgi:predicted component of type VI protein secretion system